MIKRAEHTDGFTVIQNDTLRDERLSLEARGFLAFLLTMSDGWDFSTKGLAGLAGISERTVMRLAKELKAAGYLEQKGVRNERGVITGWEWTVSEVSTVRETHSVANPQCGSPTVWDNPQCGDRVPIRNTKDKEIPKVKKYQSERNNKGGAKRFKPPTVDEVRAYCQERGNNVNPESFVAFYDSKGWMVGKNKMKDWHAAVRTWEQRDKGREQPAPIVKGDETPLQRLTRLAVERAEGGA